MHHLRESDLRVNDTVAKSGKVFSKFQMEDLVALIQNERFMLLSDPGTQKTPPACLYAYYIWDEFKGKTLWMMPSTLLQKNLDELYDWSAFGPGDCMIFTGGEDISRAKVILTSFDRPRLSDKVIAEWGPYLVAIDEPQCGLKTHDSKRVTQLTKLMEKVPRFMCLTGSLISGRLDSAYPMIRIVCPHYYTSHENFLATHSYVDPFSGKRTWTQHDKLARILAAHSTSRSFEDVHGKADVYWPAPEYVDMSPLQAAKYRELEREALIELEDRFLDGSLPGVRAIRARQILAHPEAVKLPIKWDEQGEPIEYKTYNLIGGEKTGKDERLEVHLEDHLRKGTRVVVFGTFPVEIERMAAQARKQGLRAGVIHGGVPAPQRAQIDADFREHKLDAVFATWATAATGLNWGFVNHIIGVSVSYQDDHVHQGVFRALRGKRDTALWITILAYKKAKVEERIMDVVEQKSRDEFKVNPKSQPISFNRSPR